MTNIIGLTGTIGAGKGAVSDYLIEKYGFHRITVGDLVREEVAKRGLEITRDNSIAVSEEMRQKEGVTYWLEKVAEKIKQNGWEKAIVDGVRLPSDDELLRKRFGKNYILILVDAKPEIRFERLKTRARPGFPKTIEEFEKHEKREWELFKFNETFKKAEFILDNNSTIDKLHSEIDKLMDKLGIKKT